MDISRLYINFAIPKNNSYEQLNSNGMKRDGILNAIQMLSTSQGFYGRLYERLTDGSDEAENALDLLEAQNFADVVDLVLYIEG